MNNHGGKREGAGRKPDEATKFKLSLTDRINEAEDAFNYLVFVRGNEKESTSIRMEAAKEILNRVCGKSIQPTYNSDEKGNKAPVIWEVINFANAATS